MSIRIKNILLFLILLLFFFYNGFNIFGSDKKLRTELYEKGKKALELKDTLRAEKFFQESIRKYDDAPSYYELGKIYLNRNTIYSRNKAYEYFKHAVLTEPNNIEYRYAYASLMKDFARISAFNEFKKIISIDSTHILAWLNLAELKDEDFTEYNNSVRKMSDEFYGSLQEYAEEDFKEAEKYYLKVLEIDSTNYDANLKLSLLYEKANLPQKGIPLLKRLLNFHEDKDIHLCLGLLCYKLSKMKESYEEYKKAISLMDKNEREDFTYNSVKFLIEPAFQNFTNKMNEYELKKFIEIYWKIFDPLYMTDFNERLLEHYSRVAYSNLHFSVKKLSLIGWKTNRGEVVVRYGEPLKLMRIRPSMGEAGLEMKTEVWDYKDMTFGFTDMASSGNYLFSVPSWDKDKVHSQFSGNTLDYINYLRKARYSYYEPKFEGPKFDLQYSVAQFKSNYKWYQTDVYFNYMIDVPDTLYKSSKKIVHHIGLFFFDKNYVEQFNNIDSIEISKGENKKFINTLVATSYPDSGFISFEIIRDVDKGTSVNRKEIRIRRFSNSELDISDILLAKNISYEKMNSKMIKRNNLFITPNPANQFSKSDSLFIYYEVYNLKKKEKGLTDFEQKISIKKFEEESENSAERISSSILSILGIKEENEITLTSNYHTFETNPQIFLQLDMSNYPSEKYLITVTIKDKIDNKEVSSSTVIDWKN